MQSIELRILNPTGLHARPARQFVDVAKQYKAKLKIRHGEKSVNGKSLISVLTLGVESGGLICLEADGADELSLLEALATAVATGLGEDVAAHQAVTAVADAESVGPARPAGTGIPASPGVAVGPAFHLKTVTIQLEENFSSVAQEKERLADAVDAIQQELTTLISELETAGKETQAEIFGAHREMLADPELWASAVAQIEQGQPAGQAWHSAIQQTSAAVAQTSDALLAERATDIQDVGRRVLAYLGNGSAAVKLPDHPVIILADDLTPSQTATFDNQRVLAICTASGGPTAHTAIIARSLGIPAIVSLGEELLAVADGTALVADGSTGRLIINPNDQQVAAAKEQRTQWQASQADNLRLAIEPAITTDGTQIEIVANVGSVADAEQAAQQGAEGVGLLRTEFLFLNRTEPPDEAEQRQIYGAIAAALPGLPIILRTLDIGGDKPLPYIDQPPETNPFLGIRGIRLTLQRPALFKTQLRAILGANTAGQFRIMFPMVADLSELRAARALLREVSAEVGAAPAQVGIMIEIPSAALCADIFAPEVDFFSVGTNDLTQYTLAMDRQHPQLAGQADGLHPAVLRLIAQTTQAAEAHGKWVGVCGELAADPLAATILIGLGVSELSVSPPSIPGLKAHIRRLSLAGARDLARRALGCSSAAAVRSLAELVER